MKRISDIIIALIGLILLSPILILLMFFIKIRIGSPILFKQVRPGLNGQPFLMIKFRTMNSATDQNGNLLPDHERLTKLGKILRSTSLDELPELWNVLKGDMSLVGPRPLLMEYLPLYNKRQATRHLVRPGITGWAQINGRNAISWEQKFELDAWYVEHQSFILDIKILCLTIQKILVREGISAEDHATTPKFTGNKPS